MATVPQQPMTGQYVDENLRLKYIEATMTSSKFRVPSSDTPNPTLKTGYLIAIIIIFLSINFNCFFTNIDIFKASLDHAYFSLKSSLVSCLTCQFYLSVKPNKLVN